LKQLTKVQKNFLCSDFYIHHISRSIYAVIFLQGFVGRLFREFGVVIAGAVLISAFVSLTLTPMLNAYMVRKNPKKSRFYEMSEPFFVNMVNTYESSLGRFMKKRWLAFVILLGSFVVIFFVGNSIQSELAPLEDRSWFQGFHYCTGRCIV